MQILFVFRCFIIKLQSRQNLFATVLHLIRLRCPKKIIVNYYLIFSNESSKRLLGKRASMIRSSRTSIMSDHFGTDAFICGSIRNDSFTRCNIKQIVFTINFSTAAFPALMSEKL